MGRNLSAGKRLFFWKESRNMVIDEKLIKYLEDLSFITLSGEERGRIRRDLENILAGMDLLSKLDTGGAAESFAAPGAVE